METYSVKLSQVNKEGEETFKATANSIQANDITNLSSQIASFCKMSINLSEKLKGHQLSKEKIKLTHQMNFEITTKENNFSVSFSIPSFGNYIKNHSQESLEQLIYKSYNNQITKCSSDGIIPIEFKFQNPFEKEQQKLIGEANLFLKRQQQTLKFEESEIKTVFSDFEAYSICMGLDNRHAKHIARNYFKTKVQMAKEQFEAHSIAMTALDKYGGKTLSFILSLPPLPFKAVNATQIFSELDKRRKKQDFPILRITFKNAKNQTEKIQISYYAEKSDKGRKRNDNVLKIKNRSTGQELMRVSRSGIVIPQNNAKQIVPVLQLFMRFSKDTKQTLLNYGLETGECSICGRELTDSESIRIGVGPMCRQYI